MTDKFENLPAIDLTDGRESIRCGDFCVEWLEGRIPLHVDDGKKRKATEKEIHAFKKPLKRLKLFKGYKPLWGIME